MIDRKNIEIAIIPATKAEVTAMAETQRLHEIGCLPCTHLHQCCIEFRIVQRLFQQYSVVFDQQTTRNPLNLTDAFDKIPGCGHSHTPFSIQPSKSAKAQPALETTTPF